MVVDLSRSHKVAPRPIPKPPVGRPPHHVLVEHLRETIRPKSAMLKEPPSKRPRHLDSSDESIGGY